MDNWKDVRVELPQEKTWVEVKDISTGERCHFYWSGGIAPDKWPNGKITHWRYITHSIFNPVTEEVYILELH